MRIVQVDTIRHWCGTEEVTLQLCRALQKLGLDFHLVAHPAGELKPRAESEGVPVIGVKTRAQVDPLAWLSMMRLFRRLKPDLVQLHASRDYYSAGGAARALGIPVLIRRGVILPLKRRQLRFYNKLASAVIAPSEAMRKQMLKHGVDSARLHVIPNCMDLAEKKTAGDARQRLRAELETDEKTPVVAIVARFIKAKGHGVLFGAARRLLEAYPDLQVWVAGKGPLEAELKRQVAELGLGEHVSWLGFRRDVADLYAAADVAVVPSLWAEAFGYAAVEALAQGTPVVASASGALPELVPAGQAGLIVPPGDVKALAEAVDRLLTSPAERHKFGAFGKQWVQRYEAEPIARQYLALYEQVISSRRVSSA